VWDAVTGDPHGRELRPDGAALHGALSADGRWLAAVEGGGAVRVWDVLAGTARALTTVGGEAVSRVAFPAGGRALLTEQAGAVRLWDLTADGLTPLPAPWNGPAAFSALSEDARWLVVQDERLAAWVWDMANGRAAGPSPSLGQAVTAAAVSADGRRLALLAADGTLRVWDAAAAAWLGGPMRPHGKTNRLAFCPDGERVIAAGPEPGAQVWEARTGEAIDLDTRKGATGASICFSPDGQFLVARQDAWARVWDLKTGQAVTPPLRHGTPVLAASFSADGRQVVTVSQAGTVRVWDLPPAGDANDAPWDPEWGDRPWPDIMALARLLACARLDAQQHEEPLDEAALSEVWEALRRR
jgi:WD40 repeat protein